MSVGTYKAPSLSSREFGLLAELERARTTRVTLADIKSRVGAAAPDVVKHLIRKGALLRLGPGVYMTVPLRAMAKPYTTTAAAALGNLMHGQTYFVGGLWAFAHHRLTTQRYASLLDVFVPKRRTRRTLQNTRVIFHVLPQTAFGFGLEPATIESVAVSVSDKERTLLDALEYSWVIGGMRAAAKLIESALRRVDRRKLVRYAHDHGSTATCQRLGLLLERNGAKSAELKPLRVRIAQSKSLLSMVPDMPREGIVSTSWRVVENDR